MDWRFIKRENVRRREAREKRNTNSFIPKMIRSLCLKIAMLCATLGLILGLNWYGNEQEPSPAPTIQGPMEAALHSPAVSHRSDSNDRAQSLDAIDLNLGTATELESLPGIGPVLARRIVDHRMQVGKFHSIQELTRVNGIGRKKLQAVTPLLKISSTVEGQE